MPRKTAAAVIQETLTPDRWLVKVTRNGGGESVVHNCATKAIAENLVKQYNTRYQSDDYYIEAYDADKVADWPNTRQVIPE